MTMDDIQIIISFDDSLVFKIFLFPHSIFSWNNYSINRKEVPCLCFWLIILISHYSENVKKIRLNSYIIYQYLIISILYRYHNSVTKNNLNFVKYIVLFPLRLLYCYFISLTKKWRFFKKKVAWNYLEIISI